MPGKSVCRERLGWAWLPFAALVAAGMVGCYATGAALGFRPGSFAWPFWPANGLVFAVLVRRPAREWPVLLAAGAAGELGGGAVVGAPVHVAILAYLLLDLGEAALAAWLVRRWAGAGQGFDLRTLARVGRFLAAALGAVVAAAALAALVAAGRGSHAALRFWWTHGVGDALGYAVVAPAALRALEPRGRRASRARRAEALALAAAIVAAAAAAFLWPGEAGAYALMSALLPLLAWAALRRGTAGGSMGVLLVAAVATVATALGHGPFSALEGPPGGFAAMQLYLAFVAATTLLFAAAVTERRQLSTAVARAARAEAVASLASGVAHDFGNYLSVIVGFADTALAAPGLPAAAREDVATLRDSALRAAELARQMLVLARGGEQLSTPRRADLREVVVGAEQLCRRLAGKRHRLVLRAGEEPLPVLVDRADVERILFNLITNARDAAEEGGQIAVELGREGRRALLRVADEGPGMDAETRSRVFEPFYTTKAAGFGVGLGLTSVRALAGRAGGALRLESEPGLGTRVTLVLPLVGPLPAAPDPAAPDPAAPDPESCSRAG